MIRRHTLAFLFEGQFALLVIILVLSTTSIFTTLRHESVAAQDRDWKQHVTFPLFLGILNSSGWVFGLVKGVCVLGEKLCRTRRLHIWWGLTQAEASGRLTRIAMALFEVLLGPVLPAFRSCFPPHEEDLMFKSCFDPVM